MAFKGLGFLYQLRHHRKAGNKKPPQKQLQGNEEMKGFMFHHVKAMVSVFYVTQCIFWYRGRRLVMMLASVPTLLYSIRRTCVLC